MVIAHSGFFFSRASCNACQNCPMVSIDSPLIARIALLRNWERHLVIAEAGDLGTQSFTVGECSPGWNKNPNDRCSPAVGIVTVVEGPKISRDISNCRMSSSLLIEGDEGTLEGEERVLTMDASNEAAAAVPGVESEGRR